MNSRILVGTHLSTSFTGRHVGGSRKDWQSISTYGQIPFRFRSRYRLTHVRYHLREQGVGREREKGEGGGYARGR
jgi:hypothetical protein